MFRRIFGIGLFILLLMALFGGLSSRSRAAYYEGYAAGLQAQASETSEEGTTAVPPAAPYYDGHGRFFGWGALGILGILAIWTVGASSSQTRPSWPRPGKKPQMDERRR